MAFRNPLPTVDVIIRIGSRVVLIRRKNPPLGWALPGGFVDEWERVEDAAVREAREETGLAVQLDDLLWVYSDPARDPRHHTMSVVFLGTASGTPVGQDDAAEARLFDLDGLPSPIVFDHAQMLADYRTLVETGRRPRPVHTEG